jgi:uncharacterized protein
VRPLSDGWSSFFIIILKPKLIPSSRGVAKGSVSCNKIIVLSLESKKTPPISTFINKTTMSTISTNLQKIFFDSIPKKIITSILALALVYVLICSYVLSAIPGSLFDNKVSWAPVPSYGYNIQWLKNSANQNISLWEFSNPKSDEAVLYLHGNSGRINDFFPFLYQFGGNVFSVSYPGYHESEGSPTPENVLESATLAYDEIIKKGFPENKITIVGHSMGGSPATYLASTKPAAKKLILINTFSSIQSMCMRSFSVLCAFTGKILNSSEYAKNVTIPVRQFAYRNDLNVPYEEGRKLYENFTNSKDKDFVTMDKNTHTYPDWDLITLELGAKPTLPQSQNLEQQPTSQIQ